jgi:hypothetical protein
VVPLASFAQDYRNGCLIYIERIDVALAEGKSILIGSMFFQSMSLASFAASADKPQTPSQYFKMAINVNALSKTYLGSMTTADLPTDPFKIEETPLTLQPTTSSQMPNITASLSGIGEDGFEANWLIDFNSNITVAWWAFCSAQKEGFYDD